jgi:hypothetical protein
MLRDSRVSEAELKHGSDAKSREADEQTPLV